VSWRINVSRHAQAAQNSGRDIAREELASGATHWRDQSLIEQTTPVVAPCAALNDRPGDLLAIFTS